jgi:hypothetical protein
MKFNVAEKHEETGMSTKQLMKQDDNDYKNPWEVPSGAVVIHLI